MDMEDLSVQLIGLPRYLLQDKGFFLMLLSRFLMIPWFLFAFPLVLIATGVFYFIIFVLITFEKL